jgi:hypothetical protein
VTSASVPLEIEPDAETPGAAVVRVTAEVDGQPVRFVLDAGAAQSQVVMGEVPMSVADAPQSFDTRGLFSQPGRPMGTLGSVRLAGVHRQGLSVTLAEPGNPVGNLLGVDFLDGHIWTVEFSSARLTAENDEFAAGATNCTWWPMNRGPRGHVLLSVHWDTVVAAHACWDTGAGVTVVDAGFAGRHPELFTAAGSAHGSDGVGSAETPMVSLCCPRIGSLRFADSLAAVVDLSEINANLERPLEIILGYPLLAQADWVIDLRENRWSAGLRP